ncbi:unnamed protein product [Ilex paraguariensis]|uniref:RRM domain-containing protein n=1 Tax=Ilex paraguariensis TaxID=185542 RepID=A0ABC8SKG8_9AQUA
MIMRRNCYIQRLLILYPRDISGARSPTNGQTFPRWKSPVQSYRSSGKMPRHDDRRGGTRLYVGRLSSRTRSRDLEDIFSRYGRVRDVDMKREFAFVEFSDPRDADDARYRLNGREVDGSRILVEFAKGEGYDAPKAEGYDSAPGYPGALSYPSAFGASYPSSLGSSYPSALGLLCTEGICAILNCQAFFCSKGQ